MPMWAVNDMTPERRASLQAELHDYQYLERPTREQQNRIEEIHKLLREDAAAPLEPVKRRPDSFECVQRKNGMVIEQSGYGSIAEMIREGMK